MLRLVFLASLLAVPASANTDCIVALCSDAEAEAHQATCAVRCNCHWDKNGIPGSEQYPRCYAETETVQVSIAARQKATVYYAAFTEIEGDSNRINTATTGQLLGQVSLRALLPSGLHYGLRGGHTTLEFTPTHPYMAHWRSTRRCDGRGMG